MNFADVVESIERFFLDIIGTLVPGAATALLLWKWFRSPSSIEALILIPPQGPFDWLTLVGICYVLGHAIISLGQILILRVFDPILRVLRKSSLNTKILPGHCKPETELVRTIADSDAFKLLRSHLTNTLTDFDESKSSSSVHEIRSMALSLVSDEKHIVYRFMFISLLNLAMATVIICFLTYLLIMWALTNLNWIQESVSIGTGILVVLLVLVILFLERYYSFYGRALRVPFPMAIAALKKQRHQEDPGTPRANFPGRQHAAKKSNIVVYLAGGFHSGWQDQIKEDNPTLELFDPRSHGLNDRSTYTLWDLHAITQSDILFAYLERSNPAGYALSLEIGYARALGKKIILVDEWIGSNESISRYLEMVRECADVTFDSFERGSKFLSELTGKGKSHLANQ